MRVHALQWLARRDYSRAELQARLSRVATTEGDTAGRAAEITALLDEFEAAQLLSDNRYACQRSLQRGQRYGNTRLRQELRQKGIDDETIAAALPEAGDETARCREVWQRKFRAAPADAQERARQVRFLQYRGFSSQAIRSVLSGADEEDIDA